jgi:hypothetical protein
LKFQARISLLILFFILFLLHPLYTQTEKRGKILVVPFYNNGSIEDEYLGELLKTSFLEHLDYYASFESLTSLEWEEKLVRSSGEWDSTFFSDDFDMLLRGDFTKETESLTVTTEIWDLKTDRILLSKIDTIAADEISTETLDLLAANLLHQFTGRPFKTGTIQIDFPGSVTTAINGRKYSEKTIRLVTGNYHVKVFEKLDNDRDFTFVFKKINILEGEKTSIGPKTFAPNRRAALLIIPGMFQFTVNKPVSAAAELSTFLLFLTGASISPLIGWLYNHIYYKPRVDAYNQSGPASGYSLNDIDNAFYSMIALYATLLAGNLLGLVTVFIISLVDGIRYITRYRDRTSGRSGKSPFRLSFDVTVS